MIKLDILKQELFKLVLRNKEIKGKEIHKEEYDHNIECINIITEMAGPIILEEWRKEFTTCYQLQNNN